MGSLYVKALSATLHLFCGVADFFDAKRADKPIRLALEIAAHMLAPDQGDGFAEALAMRLNQPVAVIVFFFAISRTPWPIADIVPQAIGIGEIDARIILFGRYGEASTSCSVNESNGRREGPKKREINGQTLLE